MNDTIRGNFIFDTGAYGFIMDSAFAYKKFHGSRFYNKSVETFLHSDFVRVEFDSLGFSPEYIELLNCKKWCGRFGDGIVGWDLFKNKVIKVDYDNKKIAVYNGEDFDPDPDFEKIPLTIKDYKLLFDASVELKDGRTISGPYLLDLGCVPSAVLVGSAAREYKLDSTIKDGIPFKTYGATLYNDTSIGAVFKTKNIKVGSIETKNVFIDYMNNKTGVLGDSTVYLGLVGNAFFENFEMYIDFDQMFLYLKPSGKLDGKTKYEYLGFGVVDRSDLGKGRIVTCLYPNSNAVKFGIKYGDAITHVDGRSVATFTLGEKTYNDMNKEYDLTFKRGDSTFHYKAKFSVK